MSATTFGHNGLEAVRNKEWAKAIPLLDKALESSNSPTWLLARAQAHQQLKNLEAALHDAELAYHAAAERGSGNSRKQMIEAQYRRAIIYFRQGRYADSDCCAKWSMLLAEGRPAREDDGVEKNVDENGNYTVTYEQGVADKQGQPDPGSVPGLSANKKTGFEADWNRAYAWRSQALGFLKKLPADHPGRKVSVTKIPIKPETKKVEPKPVEPVDNNDEEDLKAARAELLTPPKPAAPEPGSVPDEKLKLRADYYQSNQTVTISLFGKDFKKDELNVEFSSNSVCISPISREAAPYVVPGTREATSTIILDDEIVPEGSRWTAFPRKIELVVQKKNPGKKWRTWGEEVIGEWDGATKPPTATPEEPPALTITAPVPKEAPELAAAPAYPTSSKSGPKNWDKLEDGDDDKDSDVNSFFKTLYKGATPEQQRAMMKSFIESNGTALSTDWNDVSKRKVETIPPEGVVAKKWNE